MTTDWISLIKLAPVFMLILARVGAAMVFLPGLAETSAPATVRIGLAFAITLLLAPELQALVPPLPDAGVDLALMVINEVITGLWFGWTTRLIALALPVAAQFIGYLIGLSSVLQPDVELGSQSGVLGKLFALAAPVLWLLSGLYHYPLMALVGLFQIIPPGHILPAGDSVAAAVQAVGRCFSLALQLASPFVVTAVVWHLAMGLTGRIVSRLQIYFVSVPGQILMGLALLMLTVNAMILAWQDNAKAFLNSLPGGG